VLPSFAELYRLLLASDETTEIEAKTSAQMGEAALKTVCAYANEPGRGGGYLLLGVSRVKSSGRYQIVGVPDPDKLQNDFTNQCCNSFNETIRPELDVHVTDGGERVVIAFVPESEASDKPIYIRRVGLPKGAYRRIGSADQRCNDRDIALLYSLRTHGGFDNGVVAGASLNDIDREAMKEYRRTREEINPSAEELRLSMPDLLKSLGVVIERKSQVVITRAGLVLFGKRAALRRLMPWARVDYVIVPGKEWVPDAKERYSSVEIMLPLMLAIPKLVDLVAQDLPRAFQLKGRRARRKEIPAIPYAVIREAIVNALMHREYRTHEHSQVIKFSNRLEIRNAGHSLKAPERLGQPGSIARNPCIAAVLHETGYAETKGTGIIAMRKQMHEANLSAPLFQSNRDEDRFDVTLLTHHMVDEETIRWLGRFRSLNLDESDSRALIFVREMGYINNSMYRTINDVDVLTASTSLRRLRDEGLLQSQGKSTATFYQPTPRLLEPDPAPKAALRSGSNPALKRKVEPLPLTPDVVSLLSRIGERTPKRQLVEIAIAKLCSLRPLSAQEIGRYLRRKPNYLRQRFLQRMVKAGTLQYLYPEATGHPRQAYVAAPWMGEIDIPEEKPRRSKSPKRSQSATSLFDLMTSDDDDAQHD
jgi:ATP-dependent DNA helicase RecG